MNNDMTFMVCTMLWQSTAGWQNRPDYFDTNDLLLLADVAYLAQIRGDELSKAFESDEHRLPMDVQGLVVGLQRNKWPKLYPFLKAFDEDPMEPPLQCDLSDFKPEPISEDVPFPGFEAAPLPIQEGSRP